MHRIRRGGLKRWESATVSESLPPARRAEVRVGRVNQMQLSPAGLHEQPPFTHRYHRPKLIHMIMVTLAPRLRAHLSRTRTGMSAALGNAEDDWVAGMKLLVVQHDYAPNSAGRVEPNALVAPME